MMTPFIPESNYFYDFHAFAPRGSKEQFKTGNITLLSLLPWLFVITCWHFSCRHANFNIYQKACESYSCKPGSFFSTAWHSTCVEWRCSEQESSGHHLDRYLYLELLKQCHVTRIMSCFGLHDLIVACFRCRLLLLCPAPTSPFAPVPQPAPLTLLELPCSVRPCGMPAALQIPSLQNLVLHYIWQQSQTQRHGQQLAHHGGRCESSGNFAQQNPPLSMYMDIATVQQCSCAAKK